MNKKNVQYMAVIMIVLMVAGLVGCGNTKQVVGELTYESEVIIPRDDATEVRMEGNRSNIMNPITGGAEELAEKRRDEITDSKDELSIKGKTYYISPAGDDLNDGLSAETPFRSLDVLSWLALSEGDAILFERGSVFRVTEPILAREGVTYGAYGEGAKPCIYGSPRNYADATIWQPSRMKHVWKIDFGYGDAGNIVFNHGEYVGIKKRIGLNQLEKTGDFYHNETDGIIYLYCEEGNPGKIYKDIEISPKSSIFSLDKGVSKVTIDNLCMKYVGEFSINGLYNNKEITVTNCEMGYIGGSKLSLAVRYGNAIQFWDGTQNTTVKNCWIYQVYDTAITFQGTSKETYSNINFSDNLLEYNDMDIEIWDDGEKFAIDNLVIENNLLRYTAQGWGTRTEDSGNRGGAAGFQFILSNCLSCNATLKNNVFDCPAYESVDIITPQSNFSFDIEGNAVYINGNYRANANVVRFSGLEGGKTPDSFKATGQSELETVFKKFDKTATEIKWLQ